MTGKALVGGTFVGSALTGRPVLLPEKGCPTSVGGVGITTDVVAVAFGGGAVIVDGWDVSHGWEAGGALIGSCTAFEIGGAFTGNDTFVPKVGGAGLTGTAPPAK